MKPVLVILLVGALSIFPGAAYAHKVTVFAWVEEGTVHTESKFSGGKRVKEGRIEAVDQEGRTVAEGITDREGRFSFPVPAGARTLTVILTAGMGHGNRWTVSAEELGFKSPASTDPPAPAAVDATAQGTATPLDAEAIEHMVERGLEKQLAPLRAQLADPAWGLRDIMGGLGYILGLVGLAAYLNQRNRKNDSGAQ